MKKKHWRDEKEKIIIKIYYKEKKKINYFVSKSHWKYVLSDGFKIPDQLKIKVSDLIMTVDGIELKQ